ncbi:uncharacterized protein MONBRDRAFT_29218 [Monosiga brevicollis MX1]|uniref:PH domain-containing protein n=1 Tax=Monosiga brevicollis TaxID=81824 RepID=A9VAG5_MONBE|nr:uncharacterized protein MONBRDRAFT_29218 [Monosiga brevicollis MX1]EDQ85481.1 predicted protein [Monosiga brevicollis MX1]|eukprot:XP_001749672.1 hypothetical protein [Monosiga brevicollis MX1]
MRWGWRQAGLCSDLLWGKKGRCEVEWLCTGGKCLGTSAMAATFINNDNEKISAIVYLADGQQCRCVRVPAAGTIRDLIAGMLKVQSDWNAIGADKSAAAPSSSPDDYGIVKVQRSLGEEVATEQFLDNSLTLQSKELRAVRRNWEATMLRQIRKQFSGGFGNKVVSTGNVRRQSRAQRRNTASKTARQQTASDEYWFVSPFPKRPTKDEVRVKFVSRAAYKVSKGKQGWVVIKELRKKSRWVVYEEDTLLIYKDAEDETPAMRIDDVASGELVIKKSKKEAVTIQMKWGKTKLTMICETEVMADRWVAALRQGRSGLDPEAATQLELKSEVVDMIPELTEEEEEAEIRAALAMRLLMQKSRGAGQCVADEDAYITLSEMEAYADEEGGEDDTYLTVDDMDYIMVNREGDYLTIDAMRTLAQEAGYLTVDDMQRLAKPDGEYLTIADMQRLASDAGYISAADLREQLAADAGYLSANELRAQMAAS